VDREKVSTTAELINIIAQKLVNPYFTFYVGVIKAKELSVKFEYFIIYKFNPK
jgi:hypothetical protein